MGAAASPGDRRAGDGRSPSQSDALPHVAVVAVTVVRDVAVVSFGSDSQGLELLDHAFGLLLRHDLAEGFEVVHGLPQDLAGGVLEGVDTVALASDEGVATDAEVPHLVAFDLGHLDDPVGGVLGDTGLQGPPLGLVHRHYLPALGRKNVPEAVIIIRSVRGHPHDADVVGDGVRSWGQVVVAIGLLHDDLLKKVIKLVSLVV